MSEQDTSRWSCDDKDANGVCRNAHGCHCAEITALCVQVDELEERIKSLKKMSKNKLSTAFVVAEQILHSKIKIAEIILATVKQRKLTQSDAAGIMGIDQSKVSALFHGHLEGFTIDRLIQFCLVLGMDVSINVNTSYEENKIGQIRVQKMMSVLL